MSGALAFFVHMGLNRFFDANEARMLTSGTNIFGYTDQQFQMMCRLFDAIEDACRHGEHDLTVGPDCYDLRMDFITHEEFLRRRLKSMGYVCRHDGSSKNVWHITWR